MLLKIALLPNLTRHFALQVTKDVCAYLDSLGVTYGFEETLRGNLDTHGIFLPTDTLLSEADAVIAIGGDGSLIHAAKKAVEYGKPVLGVNAGNHACMVGGEKNKLHLLGAMLTGNDTTDRRMMLEDF